MNGLPRSPHDRWLAAWLGVSLTVHLAVLAGGGALLADRGQERAQSPPTRVVLAGRIIQSLPPAAAPTSADLTEPVAMTSRIAPPTRTARRASQDAPRSAMGVSPSPRRPPSVAASGFADGSPSSAQRHSATAPRLGRAGAAWAGPLAGGGAEALTAAGGPVGFAVATATAGGGTGPGYGGTGDGLGVGGTSGGVGGGGTPGGRGLTSGGLGGGVSGQVDPAGLPGGGGTPGPPGGSSGASPGAGGGGGAKAQPARSASAPAPASRRAPEPAPVPPQVAHEEPPAEEQAQPSPSDLAAFRAMVQSRISAAKRYPSSARDAGQEGTVKVSFSVAPSGQPSGISVVSSSGYQALDAAAQRAVSAAAPYLPFPQHVHSSIRVTATVIFRLN